MKDFPTTKIRNFTLAGHAGSGKTTLADTFLFKSGSVSRLGSVNEKNSASDYRSEEQEKQYSLYATPMSCPWNGHMFFFVDTPGNADYYGDTTAALSVCDMTLIVVDGISGIEIGTSRAWRLARERRCPRAIFVNSLDRENSDFDRVLQSLQENYGMTTCVPITIPVGKEADLERVVNVLTCEDVPDNLREQVDTYNGALMDTVAESDEELMMRYLDGEDLSQAEIAGGLHAAIISGDLVPVFAGSVGKDVGVTELMEGIVSLFPNPLMQKSLSLQEGELELSDEGDGKAFVFKSIIDPFIGQLSIIRVYSGVCRSDSELFNVTQRAKERVGSLMHLNGKDQVPIESAGPGEIIAVAKLKSTRINDTLSSNGSSDQFPPIAFPKPTMSYACYAVKKGEEDKIFSGLQRLSEEDPTALIERNNETHETMLSGLGDQHLANIVNRLKTNYKVAVDLRTPKVPYRETIRGNGGGKYRHKKQTGGHGQFAEVWLRIEPLIADDFEFVNEVVGGNIPKNFIPAVEKGVITAMENGPMANCKVMNVKATVYDGKHHPVDSSDIAFQIAGRGAFREAMSQANPAILEPIMSVRISVPEEYMGDISGDLNSRRGRILGIEVEEGVQVVNAEVPLAEMFSYSSQLRSLTQGRGTFEMEFSRFENVPANISKNIQEAAAAVRKEED